MNNVVPISTAIVPLREVQTEFALLTIGGEIRTINLREIEETINGSREGSISMYKALDGKHMIMRFCEALPVACVPRFVSDEFKAGGGSLPMIDFTEPLQFEFFRRALLAATMVGGLTGLVGVFVVLRRMSYIGHGMSHSVFGGAVVGYVAGVNFYVAAGIWGFLSAVLINQATRRRQIGADAAIGIVTTASFALGVALISRASRVTKNFDAALFGNLLSVSGNDLWVIAGVFAVTVAAVFMLSSQL